jgi:hypothetical protein
MSLDLAYNSVGYEDSSTWYNARAEEEGI